MTVMLRSSLGHNARFSDLCSPPSPRLIL